MSVSQHIAHTHVDTPSTREHAHCHGGKRENFPWWQHKTHFCCLGGIHAAGCVRCGNADVEGSRVSLQTPHTVPADPAPSVCTAARAPRTRPGAVAVPGRLRHPEGTVGFCPQQGYFGSSVTAAVPRGLPAALADESCPLVTGRAKLGNQGGLSPDKTAPN